MNQLQVVNTTNVGVVFKINNHRFQVGKGVLGKEGEEGTMQGR